MKTLNIKTVKVYHISWWRWGCVWQHRNKLEVDNSKTDTQSHERSSIPPFPAVRPEGEPLIVFEEATQLILKCERTDSQTRNYCARNTKRVFKLTNTIFGCKNVLLVIQLTINKSSFQASQPSNLSSNTAHGYKNPFIREHAQSLSVTRCIFALRCLKWTWLQNSDLFQRERTSLSCVATPELCGTTWQTVE